ncbi:MAG: hypothetical protein R6U11_10345 [Bacteroidales bacterium]
MKVKKITIIRKKPLFYMLVLSIMLSSCNVLYRPSNINTPMLTQQGETQFSAYIDHNLNLDVQTAFALTDNIGVIGNATLNNALIVDHYDVEFFVRPATFHLTPLMYQGELGIGYFTNIFGDKNFEIYGGAGMGNIPEYQDPFEALYSDDDNYLIENHTGVIYKYFIQSAIGNSVEFGKFHVERNLALRLSSVSIFDDRKYYVEPVLNFKFGEKLVRFTTSVGLSYPVYEVNQNSWKHVPLFYGLGVQLALDRLYE